MFVLKYTTTLDVVNLFIIRGKENDYHEIIHLVFPIFLNTVREQFNGLLVIFFKSRFMFY